MADFPTTIEAVENAWLGEVLGRPVLGYDTTFLEGGVLADAYKLHNIRYATGAGDPPRSVVLKMPNREDDRRAMALDNDAYGKELKFFLELADDMPLRSPKLYAALSDGTARAERFVLVMEDLTAHSQVFDQVDDTPSEAFVRKIAHEVAGMHARYWDAPITRRDWISGGAERYRFPLDTTARQAPEHLDEFRGLWREMYGHDVIEQSGAQLEELTRILCGPACGEIFDRIYGVLSERPRTLLHSDLRADNIFRSDPARGLGVDESQLTYIDWQLLASGPPGPEFTQAWQHSVPPAVRRKDRDILRQYHERLVALQPAAAEYTLDMLLEDYILGFVMWWPVIVTAGANTLPIMDKPEGARMKRLWGQAIPWMLIAMADHDCLAVVDRLANGG